MSKSIPQLSEITTLADANLFHVVQSGVDKRITWANILTNIPGTISGLTAGYYPIAASDTTIEDGNLFEADSRVKTTLAFETANSYWITSKKVFYAPQSAADKDNIAIGNGAGNLTLTGDDNNIFGRDTGVALTSGSFNNLIGAQSGSSLTTGNNNVFIGDFSGQDLVSGSSNAAFGNDIYFISNNISNSIGLGGGIEIYSSNVAILGDVIDYVYIGRGERKPVVSLGTVTLQTTGVGSPSGTVTDGSADTSRLVIAGSRGTGTGIGGDIGFAVAPAGSTGTSQNPLVEFMWISPDYTVEIGAPTGIGSSFNLSGTDIAHGITTLLPTDIYGRFKAKSLTAGGLQILGLSDTDAAPFEFLGVYGNATVTNTLAAFTFRGSKKNTTTTQDLGNGDGLFGLFNNNGALPAIWVTGSRFVGLSEQFPLARLHLLASGSTSATHGFRIVDPNDSSILYNIRDDRRFSMGVASGAATAMMHLSQKAATTGINPMMLLASVANTGQTASTEIINADFNFSATRTWATGAITTQREVLFRAPTYAFAGASTITDAATVVIEAAPIAGTNATITRSKSLWIPSGVARFDAGINTKVSVADVSVVPTDAELDATFGAPSTVGNGFLALLNDNAAGTNMYVIASDGTNWFYSLMTKAL